jgi:ATP-dependent protease Clp ATPase subunit
MSASRCNFCGKRSDEVKKLIVSPDMYVEMPSGEVGICDECIGMMMMILAGHDRDVFEEQVRRARCYNPDTQGGDTPDPH